MYRHYKLLGRRKGGTWGKPHRKNRVDANQGLRHLMKEEVRNIYLSVAKSGHRA